MIQSEAKLKKMKVDYEKAKLLEKDFKIACLLNNIIIEESTRAQDAIEGWDGKFVSIPENLKELKFLEGKYFDYKGVKGEETNTVEIVASQKSGGQKLGWLFRGKSEILIFLMADFKTHVFVEKKKLRNLVFDKIPLLEELYLAGLPEYYLSRIQGSWGRFNFVETFDKSFEEKVYTRAKFGSRDLITKISTKDIVDVAFLKIEINDNTISVI